MGLTLEIDHDTFADLLQIALVRQKPNSSIIPSFTEVLSEYLHLEINRVLFEYNHDDLYIIAVYLQEPIKENYPYPFSIQIKSQFSDLLDFY